MDRGGLGRKGEEEVKTKLEGTHEEIYTSIDEHDAQKREEVEGGTLITLPPLTLEVLNIDVKSTMDCNGKVEGSSDWSGRGSRSRGSTTSVSTSGAPFDALKKMIQLLTAGAQTSAAEAKREQSATTSSTTFMETDVKRVVEEVHHTKKLLEKTNLRVEKVEEAIQEHAKKIEEMEEDLAKMNAEWTAERITRRKESMKNDAAEKDEGQILHYLAWMCGLG